MVLLPRPTPAQKEASSSSSASGVAIGPRALPKKTVEIRAKFGVPVVFEPSDENVTPQDLFQPSYSVVTMPQVHGFLHTEDSTSLLVYTDGVCLDNGGRRPRAGCAFVFRPSTQDPPTEGSVNFRLERTGPTDEIHPQTNKRAELRAVLGAIQYRNWRQGGFRTMIIATDSDYVVRGVTRWVFVWLRDNWMRHKQPVQNKDIWKAILHEIKRWRRQGLEIKFWRIRKEWNKAASALAREGATKVAEERFINLSGMIA